MPPSPHPHDPSSDAPPPNPFEGHTSPATTPLSSQGPAGSGSAGAGSGDAGGGRSRLPFIGKVFLGVGVLSLLIAVLLGVFFFRGISSSVQSLSDSPHAKLGKFSAPVTLAEGEKRRLWVTADAPAEPACTIRDQQNKDTKVKPTGSTTSVGNDDGDYRTVGEFTAPKAGSYRFGCHDAESVLADPGVGGGVVGSVAAMFGAFALAGFGGLAVLLGIVLWIVGAHRKKSAPAGPAATPGAPGGPGYAGGGPVYGANGPGYGPAPGGAGGPSGSDGSPDRGPSTP